ncbi:MAG: CocE/NonD family hydrolase, partial [Candidatus Latescibacterota bacterium]
FPHVPHLTLAFLLLTCLSAPHSVPAQQALSKGPHEVAAQRDIMVPMRDGIRLATDIYFPSRNGSPLDEKFPVILVRTPYNKGTGTAAWEAFASHGYAVVVQDTRGRYKSGGVWHMVTDDGRDGYDACGWIVKQPWSAGKIGMWGVSYVGGTQHAAAMEKAPGLATVIPVDAMSNLGHASMRNGGAFELRFWNWIYSHGILGSRQAQDPATLALFQEISKNRKHYLANLPLRRGTTPLQAASEYEDWLVEGMSQGAEGPFWEQNDIICHPDRYKDIPVYLAGGWYDSWASNTTANFQTLTKTIKSPVYLIMGPWIHGLQRESVHGQVSFGKDAAIPDVTLWQLEWYDHWLKGKDNGIGKRDPFRTKVRIFVMGTGDGLKAADGKLNHGGYWRNEQEWPLARTRYTNWYFQPGGGLAPKAPTMNASSTRYVFDPRNPVPTIGGNISSGTDLMLQGAWDQCGGDHIWNWTSPIPLSTRNDIVVFQTGPLPEDIEVTGEIEVKLWASSSALDTDFTAKLLDIYPPSPDYPAGFDLNIGDGIIRARFRDSIREEKLMKPGTVYPFTIKLYPTSNLFKKGHRIRVDISSSNFPRFDVNPNTGEPLNDNRRVETATNIIFHDKAHPSHIVLPVIPGKR